MPNFQTPGFNPNASLPRIPQIPNVTMPSSPGTPDVNPVQMGGGNRVMDFLGENWRDILKYGGPAVLGIIGNMMASGQVNKANEQNAAFTKQMMDLANQERQRRDSATQFLLPMVARDMGVRNRSVLGQMPRVQLGQMTPSLPNNAPTPQPMGGGGGPTPEAGPTRRGGYTAGRGSPEYGEYYWPEEEFT